MSARYDTTPETVPDEAARCDPHTDPQDDAAVATAEPQLQVLLDPDGMTLWTPEGSYRSRWHALHCDYPDYDYRRAFLMMGGFGGARLIEA